MDFAEIRSRKTAQQASCTIQLDGSIVRQLEELRDAYRGAQRYDSKHNEPDTAPGIARRINELLEQARASEVTFTFRSIPTAKFDKLVNSHPITKEQRQQIKDAGQVPPSFNPETFPPALIAAASHDPKISPEEASDLWQDEGWSTGELLRLFNTAFQINQGVQDVPFGRLASVTTPSTEQLLSTAPSMESPDQSF